MYLEPIYVPGYLMMAVFDKYRQRTTCTNTVFDEVTESRCCVDDSFGLNVSVTEFIAFCFWC